MKKRILSALLVLVMVVTMIPAFAIAGTAASDRDQTWYTADTTKEEYTISTASQLLGFSDLLKAGTTFAGKTIELGANINLNEGWAATSAIAPANQWANLAGDHRFKGTFDGQNHTISGAYMDMGSGWNSGLFGRSEGGTVKNVAIVNSYIKGAGQVATVFGLIQPGSTGNVISNVYSNAYIEVGQKVGGIVGVVAGTTTVENCVFSGTIAGGASGIVGGIAAYASEGNIAAGNTLLAMTNAAFYGNINVSGTANIGGLIGGVNSNVVADSKVENCISGGVMTSAGKALVGGNNSATASVTLTNCYSIITQESFTNCTINSTKIADMDTFSVEGKLADFTDVAGGYAKPTTMIAMTSGICDRLNHWYVENGTAMAMTINTKGELLGFSDLLAGGKNFAGWNITLGADIDLNENWTAGVAAPTNAWAKTAGSIVFKGTFDGQNHTVSGIYMRAAAWNAGMFGRINGAKIKNLVVLNSYIEAQGQVGGISGLVEAGSIGNVISNVYSEAYVKTNLGTAQDAKIGGILGTVAGATTVENCVFEGTVDGGIHNIMGGIAAYVSETGASLAMTSSVFCGTINTTGTSIGGLIGGVNSNVVANITAENCISAGNLIGGASAAATMNNCYYADDQAELANVTLNKCTQVTDEELASPTATVPAGFTAMPEGYPMPITLANTVWAQDKNATTVFYGYQENETTNTEIRLVGLVNIEGTPSDTIKSVGFDVEMILENGNTWTNNNEAIYNLYTSVVTPSGTKTATELEGDYIFVATVSGIKEDYNKDITFVVKTFYETTVGEIVYNDILVFTYNPAANA